MQDIVPNVRRNLHRAGLARARPGGRVVQVGTYGNGASHIIAYELPPASASISLLRPLR